MAIRARLPLELRLAVLERDRYACRYCRGSAPFHIDHVRPWSWVGVHELDNLVTACVPCNLSKGARQWTPLPCPAMELTTAQRREALESVAGSLGHWPRWQPMFRDDARWWCTCNRSAKHFVLGMANLPAAITSHLLDAIGAPCDEVEYDPYPPMFLDA